MTRQGSWYWTPARVVAAMHVFEEIYGRPPSYTDFNPSRAQREAWERYHRDGCWPSGMTVNRHWGSWNAAIEAAGYEPVPQGGLRDRVKLPDRCAQGHEFTPENTRTRIKPKTGAKVRVCLTCHRAYNNESYKRTSRSVRRARTAEA